MVERFNPKAKTAGENWLGTLNRAIRKQELGKPGRMLEEAGVINALVQRKGTPTRFFADEGSGEGAELDLGELSSQDPAGATAFFRAGNMGLFGADATMSEGDPFNGCNMTTPNYPRDGTIDAEWFSKLLEDVYLGNLSSLI